jgi:hypothetical protein
VRGAISNDRPYRDRFQAVQFWKCALACSRHSMFASLEAGVSSVKKITSRPDVIG